MHNFKALQLFLNDIFLIFLRKIFSCFFDQRKISLIIHFSRQDNNEPQLQKDILEKLDFSSLKWKLVGVNISSSLLQILRHIWFIFFSFRNRIWKKTKFFFFVRLKNKSDVISNLRLLINVSLDFFINIKRRKHLVFPLKH